MEKGATGLGEPCSPRARSACKKRRKKQSSPKKSLLSPIFTLSPFFSLLFSCVVDLPVGRVDAGTSADAEPIEDADIPDARDVGTPDVGTPDTGSPDASDAGAEPFAFDVGTTPGIMCIDSLAGREASFAAFVANDVSLADGMIGYRALESSLIIDGDALEPPFQTTEIGLYANLVPEQPPGTFLSYPLPILEGRAGPENTQLTITGIYLNTLQAPISGEAIFQFDTPSADGACLLTFPIVLSPP